MKNPADRVNVIRFHNQGSEGDMVLWSHSQYHKGITAPRFDTASPCVGKPLLKSHRLWKHTLEHVGVVNQNGDLDLRFLSKESKGKGNASTRDSKDQAFLDAFLNPDIAHENTYKKPTPPNLEADEQQDEEEGSQRDPPSLRSLARQLMVRTLESHPYVASTTSNAAATLLKQDLGARIIRRGDTR